MRFHYWTVLIDWFHHLLDGCMPLEDSLFLWISGSEALYLFEVPLQVELFIVVAVARLGAWDVFGEKRSHKINDLQAISGNNIQKNPQISGIKGRDPPSALAWSPPWTVSPRNVLSFAPTHCLSSFSQCKIAPCRKAVFWLVNGTSYCHSPSLSITCLASACPCTFDSLVLLIFWLSFNLLDCWTWIFATLGFGDGDVPREWWRCECGFVIGCGFDAVVQRWSELF